MKLSMIATTTNNSLYSLAEDGISYPETASLSCLSTRINRCNWHVLYVTGMSMVMDMSMIIHK